MRRFLIAGLLSFAFAQGAGPGKFVAVLETALNDKGALSRSEQMFLTDELRSQAVKVLPAEMGFTIMTRENIQSMLPPDKSLESCSGSSCLVDIGRNISADYVAQGRVGRFGRDLTLTVELYETAGGKLIGSLTVKSAKADGLLESIKEQAPNLFAKVLGSGLLSQGQTDAYSTNAQHSYIVTVSSNPQGAALSIDGRSVPKCHGTPCNVRVTGGKHRFLLALDDYDDYDTLISVDSNRQWLHLVMIADFGILDVSPVLPGNFGGPGNLLVKIDGSSARKGKNRLQPGEHQVDLSHPCYEKVSFNAKVEKNGLVSFGDSLVPKTGGLSLNAEDVNGEMQTVPVWVNGVRVGSTPYQGNVPVCAVIEAGRNRERVPVRILYHASSKFLFREGSTLSRQRSRVVDEGTYLTASASQVSSLKRTHGRFFFASDFTLGTGSAAWKDNEGYVWENDVNSLKTTNGVAFGTGTRVGICVLNDLAIHGSFFFRNLENYDYVDDYDTYSTKDQLDLILFGAGLTYHFMPVNIFVTASGETGVLHTEGNKYEDSASIVGDYGTSDFGTAIQIAAGKEWSLSRNWGLGAGVSFIYLSTTWHSADVHCMALDLMLSVTIY